MAYAAEPPQWVGSERIPGYERNPPDWTGGISLVPHAFGQIVAGIGVGTDQSS